MSQPGDVVLVCYDVPGADLWHERLVVGEGELRQREDPADHQPLGSGHVRVASKQLNF